MRTNQIRPLSLAILTLTLRCLLAQDKPENAFPVRGLSIAAPQAARLDRFLKFIDDGLGPRGVNTLILRVDFNYQYATHPELHGSGALSKEDVSKMVEVCKKNKIRLIPQINLLGHQSWARTPGNLLKTYPEFDETPWVQFPEKYKWPNEDRLYCKSYCPLHPKVHEVVFGLVDELCDAFESDAFHAGLDEVFYIGEDRCPRCRGKDKSELFAGEVKRIRDHLAEKNRQLWMWGDRLLNGTGTGLGEWEASANGTYRAIDLIPKDIVICDWHYERPEPTAAYFALKGFPVVTCPWNNPKGGVLQVQDMARFREHSNPALRERFRGIVHTVWSDADSFMNEYDALSKGTEPERKTSSAKCFVKVFEEMSAMKSTQASPSRD